MPSEVYFKEGFGRRLRRITWAATAGLDKVNEYLFSSIGVVVVPPLPTVTTPPTIAGLTAAGSTLTCTPGVYTGSPSVVRQWQTDGTNVAGANGLTYVIQVADAGKDIACRESATNAAGTVQSTSNVITAA